MTRIDNKHALVGIIGLGYVGLPLVLRFCEAGFPEMSKLLENIYRAVNIALINELKILCLRMGLDIFEIIEAPKTKPSGFQVFYPDPGLGGHCIPIDPFCLTWKARGYDLSTRFNELAGEIDTNMPYFVVQRVDRSPESAWPNVVQSEDPGIGHRL